MFFVGLPASSNKHEVPGPEGRIPLEGAKGVKKKKARGPHAQIVERR